MTKTPSTPHDCPDCGHPAYLGMSVPAQCTNVKCPFFSAECRQLQLEEIGEAATAKPDDISEDPTQPDLQKAVLDYLDSTRYQVQDARFDGWLPKSKKSRRLVPPHHNDPVSKLAFIIERGLAPFGQVSVKREECTASIRICLRDITGQQTQYVVPEQELYVLSADQLTRRAHCMCQEILGHTLFRRCSSLTPGV